MTDGEQSRLGEFGDSGSDVQGGAKQDDRDEDASVTDSSDSVPGDDSTDRSDPGTDSTPETDDTASDSDTSGSTDDASLNGSETEDFETREEGDDGYVEIGISKIDYKVENREDDGEPRPVVHVFGRTQAGNLKQVEVRGFRPYFYVPDYEVDDNLREDERVVEIDDGYESINGESLTRVYTRIPADVGNIRDNYTHYEADILFPNRFRIDKDVKSGMRVPIEDPNQEVIEIDESEVEPCDVDAPTREMIIDIEVDDRQGFPEDGQEEIICLTAWDSFDDEYVVFGFDIDDADGYVEDDGGADYEVRAFDTEVEMLDAFLEYFDDKSPDLITGWNFEDFDAPYLIDRIERLDDERMDVNRLSRIDEVWHSGWGGPTIKGRATFDLLYAYQRMMFTELESYRLDAIAEEELGEAKVHYTGKIGDLWESDPEKLVEYNKVDVELCVEIDRKVDIVNFFWELARFVGCSIEDSTTPSDVVDIYVLRKAHDKFVLPSKGSAQGEEYEGGEVFEPITGIRENVIVLDLASLYPMSMVSINASPETKVSDDYDGEVYEAPNGVKFRKDIEGLTKTIVTELLEERQKKKDQRDEHEYGTDEYEKFDNQQSAIKVVMNSYYGVSGYTRFRLYDREMGSAVTAAGRAVIEYTKEAIDELGYNVVYGDTDSAMVELGSGYETKEVIDIGHEIEDEVNESYDDMAVKKFNAEPDKHRWEIEFEKLYRRFFQAGKKKRYAGHLIWNEGEEVDKIDITGFEYKRSDVARVTKEVQEEVIKRIVKGEDFDSVASYLREVIDDFKEGEFDYDYVAIPGGIGKKLDNYDTDTAHVKGAKYANEYFGTNFTSGSKPKRLYIKRVKPSENDYPPTDVIGFEYPEQVPDEFEVDWDKMLDKTLKKPISRILEALGWSWSEVESGHEQQGLSDFM